MKELTAMQKSKNYIVFNPAPYAGFGNYLSGFISSLTIAICKNAAFKGISILTLLLICSYAKSFRRFMC